MNLPHLNNIMEKNIKLKNYSIKITCDNLDRLEINIYDVFGEIIKTLIIFNNKSNDDKPNGEDNPNNGDDDYDSFIGSFMAKINLN